MTVIQTKYAPGRFGLGNEFAESEVPVEYSYRLVNRFINIKGHAEKIQGLEQLGNTLSGAPIITGLHEHVDDNGTVTLMASENGNIWKYSEASSTWSKILTGKTSSVRLLSSQMGDKLIFWNGIDRNFYTDDGGATFNEMKAIIQRGQGSSTSTSAAGLSDSNVTNWLTETFVNENDLVYNSTVGGYGIVTKVSADKLTHTIIGSAATGLGHPIKTASANQGTGDFYQVLDLVELNIIQQNSGYDNFATGTTGTSAAGVAVSGVNWLNTEIRAGDIIYNTTRAAIAMVSAVTTAQLTHTIIASSTANDSFEFYKSAMPIANWVHVNYGRAYYIDARSPTKVRISGPNDPQDMTTFERTLTAISQDYGAQQPQAETLLSLKTFQKYLVANGQKNIYAFEGEDPIQDTSAKAVNFAPVGLFPQGGMSRFAAESVGGAMTFIANDGLRNFAASFGNLSFQTANISEAIKSSFASEIRTKSTDPDEIQAIHYPRRNWLMCKVGDTIYNYNYTPGYSDGKVESSAYGSWSLFNSKLAQQKTYLVRRNGDLICAGAGGKIYTYDVGHYEDDGDNIQTVLETGWLTLQEPQLSTQLKSGTYIRPQFEAGTPVTYTITVTGDFSQISTDTVITTAAGVGQVGFAQIGTSPIGGSRILDRKLPLRWKGKQCKIRIETNDTNGPDIITGFTIYGNVLGKV
jgi:hypothetical protein